MRSQLLALSFDTGASPSITLEPVRGGGSTPRAGWGFAWYPRDDSAAVVLKDPLATRGTTIADRIGGWDRFRSTVFLGHIRGAAKRATQQDTHPFSRSHARRDILFAHAGDLGGDWRGALPLGDPPIFEPVGKTDSEWAFCWLLLQIRESGARSVGEVGWPRVHQWFRTIDELGSLSLVLTDGIDVVAYRDADAKSALGWMRCTPPIGQQILANDVLALDLSDPLDHSRAMVIVATTPLDDGAWTSLAPGEMIVVRRGEIRWRRASDAGVQTWTAPAAPAPGTAETAPTNGPASLLEDFEAESSLVIPGANEPVPGSPEERELRVHHETIYRYATAVDASAHVFRLRPVHDPGQSLLDCEIHVEPEPAWMRSFDDVFGNHTIEVEMRGPYSELRITAASRVKTCRPVRGPVSRSTLPLVWMPWQRQMMLPYLLPPELPETQLRELSEFAMSFAAREDFDLVETLADINRTIWRDFHYIPGVTTLETTPFDVYASRQGVCQDFANLFICLARLLNVPARYRVGYIYTGADYTNRLQSEASHAWAEVYLPWLGWRGYDPTNGCLAGTHHVRVAVGRNYRDATPTSGTLYRGGHGEALTVEVRIEPV